jgi:hypothetical protein
MLLNAVKTELSNHLTLRSIRRYRSRVGWQSAGKYERYLKRCRAKYTGSLPADPAVMAAVDEFRRDGVTSLWTPDTERLALSIDAKVAQRVKRGEELWVDYSPSWNYNGNVYCDFPEIEQLFRGALGSFLTLFYGTFFKVYRGVMFKTFNDAKGPVGSQIWHSDSGPGTCVNVMYYLHETDSQSGTLEALPWRDALAVYETEVKSIRQRLVDIYGTDRVSKDQRRLQVGKLYGEEITRQYKNDIRQPCGKAGLLVPFLNNTLHRGGFPGTGRERRAIVFQFYPSAMPTPYQQYRTSGITVGNSYPKNPDF